MSTDNTLSNTLSTLIQTLTDLKAALDRPQLEKAPDLSEYVTLDALHDEVRDAMHDTDALCKLAEAVEDELDKHRIASMVGEHLDYDDIAEGVKERLEIGSEVEDYISNNFDPSDHDIATRDYVDSAVDEKLDERDEDVTRRITEAVNERLDVERLAGLVRVDLEAKLKQLVREELRKILTKGLDE